MFDLKVLSRLSIGITEFLLFASPAFVRWIASRLLHGQMEIIGPHFNADFYLLQFRSKGRRARVARAPLLHYVVFGWREHRSPNRRFNPVFYNDEISPREVRGNPFKHFLERPDRTAVPQNEVEYAVLDSNEAPSTEPNTNSVLCFHHARGGGSTRFLAIYEAGLRAQGFQPIRLRTVPRSDRLLIWHQEGREPQTFDLDTGLPDLIRFAQSQNVRHILVSHVIDMLPSGIFEMIEGIAGAIECRFDVILHDYLCVCPRVNLIDSQQRPCSIPAAEECRSCVKAGGGEIGDVDPVDWRRRFGTFLEKAANVIVPSADMQQRLRPFIARPMTIWAPQPDPDPWLRNITIAPQEDLRICILGNLNIAKGSRVIAALAAAVREENAKISIQVLGDTSDRARLKRSGVKVSGRYVETELAKLIFDCDPHIIFLPAIWPESWSFVLTTALQFGFPVVAFDHGAQSERLQRAGQGHRLLPLALMDDPQALLAFFEDFRRQHLADVPASEKDVRDDQMAAAKSFGHFAASLKPGLPTRGQNGLFIADGLADDLRSKTKAL